jgi:methylmalonyl-CoA/ethylmalonyl-CoA epimerase
MMQKVSHIGIAVKNIDLSTDLFRKLLGTDPAKAEDLPENKVRTVMFELGNSCIELTEATDAESPIAKFIEKRGEGIHHISFAVKDIDGELARLKNAGFQLIDERPRPGVDGSRVAFLHPKSTNGVLIELSQERL